jgi:hypothetical protein
VRNEAQHSGRLDGARRRAFFERVQFVEQVRLKSRLPSRCSSVEIARDTTGGDTPRMSAARVKLFASTTVQNTLRVVR